MSLIDDFAIECIRNGEICCMCASVLQDNNEERKPRKCEKCEKEGVKRHGFKSYF